MRSRSNVSFLKQANRVADESSGFKVDEADGDAKSLYPKRSGVEINFRKIFSGGHLRTITWRSRKVQEWLRILSTSALSSKIKAMVLG